MSCKTHFLKYNLSLKNALNEIVISACKNKYTIIYIYTYISVYTYIYISVFLGCLKGQRINKNI
jgi:hypothetical protein